MRIIRNNFRENEIAIKLSEKNIKVTKLLIAATIASILVSIIISIA